MPITPSRQPSWRTDKRKTAERGYGGRWQRERAAFLARAENALCVMCKADGRVQEAQVVDHKVPHRGVELLMWDQGNWQGLCKACHSGDKQREEKSGHKMQRIGADGWPVAPGGA